MKRLKDFKLKILEGIVLIELLVSFRVLLEKIYCILKNRLEIKKLDYIPYGEVPPLYNYNRFILSDFDFYNLSNITEKQTVSAAQ